MKGYSGYRIRDLRKRNEDIREFHKKNPELTLRELAAIFKLSHQRIHEILRGPGMKKGSAV